jgi:hypothetical protein
MTIDKAKFRKPVRPGETRLNITSTRRAAAAQYSRIVPVEYVHPLVRTQKRLDLVLIEIEEMPGIVLYTLLQENLVARLEEKCRALGFLASRSCGSPNAATCGGPAARRRSAASWSRRRSLVPARPRSKRRYSKRRL